MLAVVHRPHLVETCGRWVVAKSSAGGKKSLWSSLAIYSGRGGGGRVGGGGEEEEEDGRIPRVRDLQGPGSLSSHFGVASSFLLLLCLAGFWIFAAARRLPRSIPQSPESRLPFFLCERWVDVKTGKYRHRHIRFKLLRFV